MNANALSPVQPATLAEPEAMHPQASSWSLGGGKRIFDLLVAATLLVLVSPVFVLLAAVVKLTSHGPAFFRQPRLGRGGREFELLKFRSMEHRPAVAGPLLTRRGDSRVTKVGRLLRKTKLDELPQLINVVRGDMTMVGPRPDVARYIRALEQQYQAALLALTPGVTGAASLQFYDEETVLATVPPDELEKFYVTHILPKKVAADLEYAQRATFLSDFACVLATAFRIVR